MRFWKETRWSALTLPALGLERIVLTVFSNNSVHEDYIFHRCFGGIFKEVAIVVTVRVNGPRRVLRGIA